MPKAMPEEFRRRAVELTRQEGASVPQIAKDRMWGSTIYFLAETLSK
jgi:transposase